MDIMAILTELWENHRHACIGVIIGLLIGVCFASFGFWRTLIVLVCVAVGLLIGRLVDKNGSWGDFFQRFKKQ